MKKILIYGAGAIGRGYLAPLLQKFGMEISFVDRDQNVITGLKSRKTYRIAITGHNDYEFVNVPIENAYIFGEKINVSDFDLVFSCVGPSNCYDLAEDLKDAKAVISCENDMATVSGLQKLTGNPNIYFGIPDVITSNTAPSELLDNDPLMAVTEKGVLVIEKGEYTLPKEILQVNQDELKMHWMCKLFIHNAPHAIAAYLGYLKGYKFIHESMKDKKIKKIVIGSIKEITQGMIKCGFVNKNFANYYMKKEINRFSNNLLFDPISRVARDPIRKLSKDNRLILALRIALFNKKIPHNTAIGVKAAINYYDKKDSQSVHLKMLLSSLGYEGVLEKVCGLNKKDPLNKLCVKQNFELIL